MKKPVLLLLHGAIATEQQFDRLVPLLSDSFDCHRLTFSGHGDQSLDEDFGIERFANDVVKWLDSNNIDSIDIFGYSMGGYVATYLAIHHPERIGRIFTLATKFDWSIESASQEVKMLNTEKIEAKVPKFAALLESQHNDWKSLLSHTAQMMLRMGETPLITSELLTNLKHQILISVGDRDTTASAEAAREISQQLENGQLLVLPNTPHPFEKVNLDVLGVHILDFFKTV